MTTEIRDHYVYRSYDADGQLLYVGCTKQPAARHKQHRDGSAWYPYAARFVMCGPMGKVGARALEYKQNNTLGPAFGRTAVKASDILRFSWAAARFRKTYRGSGEDFDAALMNASLPGFPHWWATDLADYLTSKAVSA